eukprot:CAMPEP_0181256634 /NCGR_PEP_ID=MMETSP1096-20121128/49817_1 /TAXON_ID=156174 ORGANISM="Chrysochromulina ericina, Strain CCMP281" /NCGR_SAMPLE_ID=MMETSP1096 /ASSEMBLY_ACC=CAM_ASM_000453 /LENGTH=115 /DNA_ID=CAMNT_0023354901 /DNA_START=27 /DNA_END=374 /DNA_ORIENTATION=+
MTFWALRFMLATRFTVAPTYANYIAQRASYTAAKSKSPMPLSCASSNSAVAAALTGSSGDLSSSSTPPPSADSSLASPPRPSASASSPLASSRANSMSFRAYFNGKAGAYDDCPI